MHSSVDILYEFARLLEDLGIRYVVVGSFASSARGQPRATIDADIVAEVTRAHAHILAERLAGEYYADEDAIRHAVLEHGMFNAIHLESMFKVDVYVSSPGGFDQEQLLRRLPEHVKPDSTDPVYVATAEDTVLAKLVWFRKGAGVSEKQWFDVLGVLGIQKGQLDIGYLSKWAAILGVSDLLEKAISETR
jgi:hypothetical protein